jgi:hypothetical protein
LKQEQAQMGITPITSLTPLPLARSIEAELEPLPMERVENSARTGDETYSPSNGKSARGAEDDEPEAELEGEVEEFPAEDQPESTEPPARNEPGRPISFFA